MKFINVKPERSRKKRREIKNGKHVLRERGKKIHGFLIS